ncbi:MAG: DivIVA domain-containing protein [Pseudomonadota bacterium]
MKNPAASHELSPAEIKNRDFKKTMLGYSPEEVVGFLDQVAKVWEKVQKKERELIGQINDLKAEIKGWENKQDELAKLQELAKLEAQKIVNEAELRSQEVRQKTEQWLTEVLEEVQQVEKRKANFITAFRSALDSHYEILKTEQSDSGPLTDKLHAYLKNSKPSKGKEATSLC